MHKLIDSISCLVENSTKIIPMIITFENMTHYAIIIKNICKLKVIKNKQSLLIKYKIDK